MEELKNVFLFPLEKMKVFSEYMEQQMIDGLKGKDSDLKMIPSFIDSIATGDEVGIVLSVEIGGSRVRVAKVHLQGWGRIKIEKCVCYPIEPSLKTGSSEALFSFVAECIKEIKPENGIKMGLSFSYPCIIKSRKSGSIVEWTKGFDIKDCIGKDPVQLLQQQLQKRGINVQIVALCNDSVGTLISYSYFNPKASIGVRLGLGTNAAYRELVSNIPKLRTEIASETMIINMEWGALGTSNKSILPFSSLDEIIDRNSTNPGKQYLDKLMAGHYLGELVRLWILELYNQHALLIQCDVSSRLFTEQMSFDTPLCSTILLDDSEEFIEIQGILDSFGIHNSTLKDRRIIYDIVECVVNRSARLMGVCLYTVLNHMKEYGLQGSVGIDSTLYKFIPGYKSKMIKAIKELGIENVNCGIVVDGAIQGTAIIAYASCSHYL